MLEVILSEISPLKDSCKLLKLVIVIKPRASITLWQMSKDY